MKVLCVEGTWVVRTKEEIDPQVTYSGWRSLAFTFVTVAKAVFFRLISNGKPNSVHRPSLFPAKKQQSQDEAPSHTPSSKRVSMILSVTYNAIREKKLFC